MQDLNLPKYDFKLKTIDGSTHIFDLIRKKYVKLTDEEWVRQHLINYLVSHKGYAMNWMAVEYSLSFNSMKKRADIVCFNHSGSPLMIVECKSAKVKISQPVFEQIARYNASLHVPYLLVSNGLEHLCCQMDYQKKSYRFLQQIPNFKEIN